MKEKSSMVNLDIKKSLNSFYSFEFKAEQKEIKFGVDFEIFAKMMNFEIEES